MDLQKLGKYFTRKGGDPHGKTELHRAAELNKLSEVEKMLSGKVNINVKGYSRFTPLHLAAKNNSNESHFKVIEALLKHGADPNARDRADRTPLYHLVSKGNLRTVQLLLDFNARVDVKTKNKENLLFPAVCNFENPKVLQLLIDFGLDVNLRNENELTPLAKILRSKDEKNKIHLDIIKTLINNKASVNLVWDGHETPVHVAVDKENLELFRLLLDSGADIHAEGKGNRVDSLLYTAISRGRYDFVKLLINLGFDVNFFNSQKISPLLEAAKTNKDDSHYEIMKLLLNKGAEIDARDRYDQTPLYYLLEHGNLKVVQLFLNFKADVKAVNKDGETMLLPAMNWGNSHLDVLQLLVDLGVNINHRDNSGKTVLHVAAKWNSSQSFYNILEFLLKNKADPNARDGKNKTPLQYLMEGCNLEIFKLFLSYNADINVVDNHKQNLLFFVMKNPDVLQLLIDLGLDVNHSNGSKKTPLHLACATGDDSNLNVVKCLLKNGACLNVVDNAGYMPVMRAVPIFRNQIFKQTKMNFILKYTDFNDQKTINNILSSKNISSSYRNFSTKQLSILKSLNIHVDPAILNVILYNDKYRNYYKKCQEELLRAKNTKFKNSWLNFFNLLVDSRRKLKNYAGNNDLMEEFGESVCENQFPNYGFSIDRNVKKGIKRRELFDRSIDLLSDCLPIFNPTHLIIRDVLDCILCKKDLSKFCN